MSEVELYLIQDGENCTIYTLQFLRDIESEFEKFVSKFRDNAEYSEDFSRIATFIKRIARTGASERYFRPEGRMNDSVVALPVTSSKLRVHKTKNVNAGAVDFRGNLASLGGSKVTFVTGKRSQIHRKATEQR